jgi:hypothetical protein
MWFNGTSSTTYGRLLSFSNFAFEIAAGGNTISVYDGSWRATGASGIANTWHHVAVTNDMTNMVVYLDGQQIYTKASATFNFTGQNMFLAAQGKTLNTTERFAGKIDEFRIWNVARTAQQILNNYQQQLIGTETGLIAYYNFNNDTPTNIVNSANYVLSANSSPTYLLTNYEDYLNDYALSFDGFDDRLLMLTPISGNADFTLETQFKTSAGNANQYRRLFGWTSYAFEVAIVNGKIYTYKGSWSSASATTFNDGQWHHLAVSKSGTAISIYVDGNLLSTRTLTLNLTSSMFVGGSAITNSPDDYFNGQLDEIRIWNIARTQPQIEADMNTVLAGNETGLIQYFDLNTPTTTANINNLVVDGDIITRSGSGGTNNLPPFVAATKNEITTSISEIFSAENEVLSVYPNPVNDVLNINNSGLNKIIVLDAAGKEVMNVTTASTQIDLSYLNQGVYFLQVSNNEEIKTAKIIKD